MKSPLLWNRLRWYARLPIKWGLFVLTVLIVCFPYPHVLVRHLNHWRDPNAMIDPNAPALQPLIDELTPQMEAGLPPKEALRRVERFVYHSIPYDWDWNTWGTADYLPTVQEALAMGREDCDGRAVVAASLLRRFGFHARLVADFAHMWVQTDQGELMGPQKKKAVEATEKGIRINWSALTELPRSLVFGIAVFPFKREVIVIAVLWLLLIGRGVGPIRMIIGLALLMTSLVLVRAGGEDFQHPRLALQWAGAAAALAALGFMLFGRKYAARSDESPGETPPDSRGGFGTARRSTPTV